MKIRITRELFWEVVRFGIVGVIATCIHWGIYYLLIETSPINVNIAYTLGYLISFCCNFILSSKFTFKSEATALKGVGFALSHLCNYLLHMLFLNLFLHWGLSEELAPIPTLCIVVPINFCLVRTVFKSGIFTSDILVRQFYRICARLYLFVKAHLLNPLWKEREARRETRRAALVASVPWFFKKTCMGGLPDDGPVHQDEPERIFSIWFQGEDNAPELVKACFRSIRRHCDKELVVLDSDNLYDWITLPRKIVDKYNSGRIKTAHFADICRLELLYEHGGYWIDSTCFLTDAIPEWISAEPFFVYMTEKLYGSPYSFIQNCFIRAQKGDYLLGCWRSMLLDYWCHHSGRMDYFQHQLCFKGLVEGDGTAAEHFGRMPKVGQDATHVLGALPIDTPYDEARFKEATSGAFFQKLTYRGADDAPEGSMIDFIKKS